MKTADKTKNFSSEKLQKTKETVSSPSGNVGLNTNTKVELNTPAANAKVGLDTNASVSHQE
ncbi:hypothetical protein E0H80_03985 [Acinetobacter sp. ANC 4779]|uniref:hypothetical protein n=1 Tax=Acinetobacter sp. ANC 4779 TaxID=2529848 RepID=UPI001038B3D9|nr:hypothetical protein [Acinetobacter sp. ANC 4779]TCB51923.1 hypothetical protein E0H80_03985 [Acinetobacter sp. ANC 4779]